MQNNLQKKVSQMFFSDKDFYIFWVYNHSAGNCQILKWNTLYLTAKPINW